MQVPNVALATFALPLTVVALNMLLRPPEGAPEELMVMETGSGSQRFSTVTAGDGTPISPVTPVSLSSLKSSLKTQVPKNPKRLQCCQVKMTQNRNIFVKSSKKSSDCYKMGCNFFIADLKVSGGSNNLIKKIYQKDL